MNAPSKTFTAALALLIPFLVVVGYYLTHKPFDPPTALAVGMILWRLLATASIVSLAGAIGRQLFPLDGLHPLAALCVQACAGLGILAVLVLAAGVTLGLPAALFWLALPVGLIVLRRPLLQWLEQWHSLAEMLTFASRFERGTAALILLMLFSSLWVALAPPFKYDALVYHLTLPATYLADGRISHLPWLIMSGYPQTAELLYTWAMALGGAPAATVLGWCFSLLALAGLTGLLTQCLNSRAAWAAAAALFAGSSMALYTSWGYVDWLGLLFGLACLIMLDHWQHSHHLHDLRLAGALAGMAFAVKYPFGLLALTGVLWLGILTWRNRTAVIPPLVNFGLAATMFALPWLLKNLLYAGNPIYPFFFPAAEMDAVRLHIAQQEQPFGSWIDALLLPLRATIFGMEGAAGFAASIGPLMLAFGVLAWIGRRHLDTQPHATLGLFSLTGLFAWLLWAIASRFSGLLLQTRMMFPLLPIFAVLAGFGFKAASRLKLSRIRVGRILVVLALMSLAFTTIEVSLDMLRKGAPQAALAITSESDYLAHNLGWFQPAMQAIQELPAGSRVLMIYEPRSLYCLPVCRPDESLDRWHRDWMHTGKVENVSRQWLNEGFTHVLVFRSGVEFMENNPDPKHPAENLRALDIFLSNLPAPQNFGGVYELYTLRQVGG